MTYNIMQSNVMKKNLVKKSILTFNFGNNIQLLLLCLPAIVFLFIFNYIPMGGLIIAFKDFRIDKGFWGSEWIGLKNFEFFFKSETAWRVTRNTVCYNAVFIISGLIFSLILAILLYEITNKFFVKVYQTLMFVPYFLSWVVVSCILFSLIDPKLGFLNRLIASVGIQPPDWYFDPKWWPAIFILMNLWKGLGYSTVIYYAAIIGINQEYYEAAKIDGANKFQTIKNITIPFLMPLICMLTLISIGRIFNANFDMFFNLPKDNGLLYSTCDVIDTYVYRALKVTGDTGMAMAAGFYQSIVGFILVLGSNYIVGKINDENTAF